MNIYSYFQRVERNIQGVPSKHTGLYNETINQTKLANLSKTSSYEIISWASDLLQDDNNEFTGFKEEMKKRVKKLWFPLLYRGGFDILLTHSPAYQLNDGLDLPHQGFQVFNTLMDKYHPRFFIHGHVHMSYGRNQKRYDQYNQTHVINAYDRCVFDYEDDNLREHLKR